METRRRLVGSTLAFALAIAATGRAQGETTFIFDGEITSVTGPALAPFPDVQIGDPVRLTYTFDPTTPDASPLPSAGSYNGAVLSLTLNIDGDTASDCNALGTTEPCVVPEVSDFISVSDTAFFDVYNLADALTGVILNLQLQNLGGSAFSSDALPTTLTLADFGNRSLVIDQTNPTEYDSSVDAFQIGPVAPPPGFPITVTIQPPPELTLDGQQVSAGQFTITRIRAFDGALNPTWIPAPDPIDATIGSTSPHFLFEAPAGTRVLSIEGFFDASVPDLPPANFNFTLATIRDGATLELTVFLPTDTDEFAFQLTDLGTSGDLSDNVDRFVAASPVGAMSLNAGAIEHDNGLDPPIFFTSALIGDGSAAAANQVAHGTLRLQPPLEVPSMSRWGILALAAALLAAVRRALRSAPAAWNARHA
jgi:hypothetical protein